MNESKSKEFSLQLEDAVNVAKISSHRIQSFDNITIAQCGRAAQWDSHTELRARCLMQGIGIILAHACTKNSGIQGACDASPIDGGQLEGWTET